MIYFKRNYCAFGSNNNQFKGSSLYDKFGASAELNRGDDIMLRYDRLLSKHSDKWSASIISVYRIQGDKINHDQLIDGSEGLSLNLAINRKVILGNKTFELLLAGPIHARKVRIDGSTRNIIFGIKFKGF